MARSYRYDPDEDFGPSRKQMKQARKAEKMVKRAATRKDERMDGGEDREQPFDVMSTIDPSWGE